MEAQDPILGELRQLNDSITKENSFTRKLVGGMIYGVGFVIGSAIVATILIGLFAPLIGQIGWVRSAFQTGSSYISH